MGKNPSKQGLLTENSAGIGSVSREMVRQRAIELAVINGRPEQEVSKSDWEDAKRELLGESDTYNNDETLESAPESERWDPVHGSSGVKPRLLPAKMRTKRGAAITSDWLRKAYKEPNMIKCAKPPNIRRKTIYDKNY